MRKFQIYTSVHPNEAMRRFSLIIDQSVISFSRQGQNFVGWLDGYSFWFRRLSPHRRDSFAPICSGSVAPNPDGGSVIHLSIGVRLTVFYIFAGVFTGFSAVFGIVLGLITTGVAFSLPSSEMPPAAKAASLLPFLIPLGAAAFLALLLFIGKWMGKSDEEAMISTIQQIFADTAPKMVKIR